MAGNEPFHVLCSSRAFHGCLIPTRFSLLHRTRRRQAWRGYGEAAISAPETPEKACGAVTTLSKRFAQGAAANQRFRIGRPDGKRKASLVSTCRRCSITTGFTISTLGFGPFATASTG